MDKYNTSAGQQNDNTTSNGVCCSALSIFTTSLGSVTFESSQGPYQNRRAAFRGLVGLALVYVGYKVLMDRNCLRCITDLFTNGNNSPPTTQVMQV